MEQIILPPTLKVELQKQIKKFQNQSPKPKGYLEITSMAGVGAISKGSIAKINSFFNTMTTDHIDKEKAEVYGSALRSFCANFIDHQKTKKAHSNSIRISTGHPSGASTGTPQNRNIDRLNSVNTSSTKPPKVAIGRLMQEVEVEREIAAMKRLMVYRSFKRNLMGSD